MRGHPRKRQHSTKVPQESELPGGVVVTARPAGGLQTPCTAHLLRRSEQLMGSHQAPMKADRRRTCTSQRSHIPPSPGEVPQQPCCQCIPCLQMAAVRT